MSKQHHLIVQQQSLSTRASRNTPRHDQIRQEWDPNLLAKERENSLYIEREHGKTTSQDIDIAMSTQFALANILYSTEMCL